MSICKTCRNHDKCKFDFKDKVNTCSFIYPEEIPIINGKAELEEHDKKVRNKAIDEFKKEIRDWQIDIQDNEYDADKFDFVFERIYEIAEQMKGV